MEWISPERRRCWWEWEGKNSWKSWRAAWNSCGSSPKIHNFTLLFRQNIKNTDNAVTSSHKGAFSGWSKGSRYVAELTTRSFESSIYQSNMSEVCKDIVESSDAGVACIDFSKTFSNISYKKGSVFWNCGAPRNIFVPREKTAIIWFFFR